MATEPGPGVVLSGHLLSEELGRGAQARVFRAEPLGGGSAVAIKVAVRPDLVAALRKEGAVLRRLRGRRFVRILEEHLDADPPCFVLELCAGGSLRALLERSSGRRLAPAEATRIATEVLEGVAFLHDEGIVHGDLKPENVLLDGGAHVKIADLGLSRAERTLLLRADSRVGGSDASAPGGVRGTLDYLAPELLAGGAITPRSDVYALGVLLYELLVGRRPFGSFELPGALLGREGTPVPEVVDRVVGRALARDPAERFADAGALLAELEPGTGRSVTDRLARAAQKAAQGADAPPAAPRVRPRRAVRGGPSVAALAASSLAPGVAAWAAGSFALHVAAADALGKGLVVGGAILAFVGAAELRARLRRRRP